MQQQQCTECGSTRLCETREADLTCMGCGLVIQSGLMDDRAYGQHTLDDFTIAREPPNARQSSGCRHLHEMLGVLEERFGIEPRSPCGELCVLLSGYSRDRRESRCGDKTWSAVCVFAASKFHKRGLTAHGICSAFDVDIKRFWQETSAAHEVWKDLPIYPALSKAMREMDIITRMVDAVEEIPEGAKRWRVIRVATDLEERTRERMQSVKPSCLAVTLVYIACMACNIEGITKQRLASQFHVSVATMVKHEARIQEVLVARV